MDALTDQDYTNLRQAWNTLALLGSNHLYLDNNELAKEGKSVDVLWSQFQIAASNGKIGVAGARAMIDKFTQIAGDQTLWQKDIYFNFTKKPFGTVIYK